MHEVHNKIIAALRSRDIHVADPARPEWTLTGRLSKDDAQDLAWAVQEALGYEDDE